MARNATDGAAMTPKEFAGVLGLHPETVRTYIRQGFLKAGGGVGEGHGARYSISPKQRAAFLKKYRVGECS